MSPTKDRQRAAARARLEREMAERAEKARRRRQLQIGIAAGATVLLLLLGTVWLINRDGNEGAASPSPSASGSALPGGCQWIPVPDPSASPAPSPDPVHIKNVGTPPTEPARSGTQTMTITTNQGAIEISLYTTKAPCSVASMAHLASQKFFDNTKCHQLSSEGDFRLFCGSPASDGQGGPSYRFQEENLPSGEIPTYPEGIVAINRPIDPASQQVIPNSSGSQFFIVYKDSGTLPADFPVIGKVSKGLDVVKKISEAGATNGKPKTDVTIQTVTVSPPS